MSVTLHMRGQKSKTQSDSSFIFSSKTFVMYKWLIGIEFTSILIYAFSIETWNCIGKLNPISASEAWLLNDVRVDHLGYQSRVIYSRWVSRNIQFRLCFCICNPNSEEQRYQSERTPGNWNNDNSRADSHRKQTAIQLIGQTFNISSGSSCVITACCTWCTVPNCSASCCGCSS